jgi:hypothetical protein
MSKPRRPWKHAFRKLPRNLLARLDELEGRAVKIASARPVPKEETRRGYLRPVGVKYSGEALLVPSEPVVPPASSGVWARRNREGWEIVRKDLPTIEKTFSVDTPNWGDWSYGSHTVDWTRDVYQREVVSPLNAGIRIVHEGTSSDGEAEILRFELDDVFDPSEKDFLRQVLFGVNVLQESVGCADIFDAQVSSEEVMQYRFVNWIILPPGSSDEAYKRAFMKLPKLSQSARLLILERKKLLEKLKPRSIVLGSAFGSNTYFGAQFEDDLVVFENMESGNAIYIMFEDWEKLSKLSRSELLRDYTNYVRIVHTTGWEERLEATIDYYRKRN